MNGAPGLAGRDPPRDEETWLCPDCGDEDEFGDGGCCESCSYRAYLEGCKT